MKIRTAFIVSLTAIVTLAASDSFSYSGGGTQENPYKISSAADWQTLMNTSADWDNQFLLTADVNLAQVTLTPVGNLTTNFTGVFDGNDHVIRNAVINQPTSDRVGLFGRVGSGQIRNLIIENVNVTGREFVGGLVGENFGSPVISCRIAGTVSGSMDVGGLVGCGSMTITNCYSSCAVSGGAIIGGLAGDPGGDVTGCSATGDVTGTSDIVGGLLGKMGGTTTDCHATGNVIGGGESVGGLVGSNFFSTIRDCYATGTVSSSSNAVGGLAGMNGGPIRNCYATGTVSSSLYAVGGLVGQNGYPGTITDSYATGIVSGSSNVGGLVGENFNTISYCYAIGTASGSSNVGGLVGLNFGGITAGFWDTDTSNTNVGVGYGSPDGVIPTAIKKCAPVILDLRILE